MSNEKKRFWTLSEIADQLRLSRSKVAADKRSDALPTLKFGRVVRVRQEDLEAYRCRAARVEGPGGAG